MSIHSIAPTRDVLPTTSTNVAAQQAQNMLNQSDFLKLLTTQLSNQDPTNPQDQSAFLAQLAQFSTVQGVDNLQESSTRAQAADLLGKTVHGSIVQSGANHEVIGAVTSVRWDTDGIHITLDDTNKTTLLLDQVNQIDK
jgi:flagellar basal-body rod modification protein FlgD